MNASDARDARLVRIGRYVLTRTLGAGGMGEVYKARAYGAAGVEKDLCVKRIRHERLSSRPAVERFIEEARLSMTLTHGNIVQVFDFGRSADEYFLAMEWVDGADLGRVLEHARSDRDPLAPVVAVHVSACLARALAYAHAPTHGGRAVIHCDLKPANVLLSRSGEVKLADFGAAATLGTDITAGTKGYMAPERALGSPADARVDLYSLGVVLVEMLSGHPPPHDDAHHETVPADLRELVRSLLESDPAQRAADARIVADSLEAWVSRARASGSLVPAADLARRAAASAIVPKPLAGATAIETDASFERDGNDDRAFHDRMTAPTRTEVPRPRSNARGWAMPGTMRWRSAVFLIGLGIGAMLFARLFVGTSNRRITERVDGGARPRATTAAPAQSRDAGVASATAPDAGPTSAPRNTGTVEVVTERVARVPPATLDVNAIPWAEITIDGRRVGESPVFGIEVAPGRHTIVLTNPELGARRTTRIVVASGEHRHVVLTLDSPAPPPTEGPAP